MANTIDKRLAARVSRVMDLVRDIAAKEDKANGTYTVSNRIDAISLHFDGYGERGYTVGKSGIIAAGNWNSVTQYDKVTKRQETISTLPERLSDILTKLGVECEWSDEWRACDDCGVLLRVEADSHWWTPAYHDDGGASAEFVCLSCHGDDVGEEEDECDDVGYDSEEPTSPDDCREVYSKPQQ